MKNHFHEFRQVKKVKMQSNFVFVDTEANFIEKKNFDLLTFKLGCAIFWNRNENQLFSKTYLNRNTFWNDLEKRFSKEYKELILFAHNTKFDIKMLDGYSQLIKRGWLLDRHYVRNKTFIITFKKKINSKLTYTLRLWDTTNYVSESLESLGESVGYPKLKVDFKRATLQELITYCKRDTEILYQFIKSFIELLEQYDLSNLRATIGSISYNIFRHKFYFPNTENNKIYIHNWTQAIKLERESYKGGITDCFKIGEYQDVKKTDINSMYGSIMKNLSVPVKLLYCSHETAQNQDKLFDMYDFAKENDYGVIMKCTIELPENNAYILNKFNDKSMFAYGRFEVAVCSPELKFIEKYGKILAIHRISIYRMKNIFKEFVEFFYDLRLYYKKRNNEINDEMCKLIVNTQYGKWAQREIEYETIDRDTSVFKEFEDIIKLMVIQKQDIIRENEIVYLGAIMNEGELYVIDKKLIFIKQTQKNSFNSFVAIASFITSQARMMLVNYLKIAERENVYYCDTDSLFINEKGYQNLFLNGCIDDITLGKLKIEGIGKANFYSPKFYDFTHQKDVGIFEVFLKERKCKGIKKGSVLINENGEQAIYEIEMWQNFKSDLKAGILDEQIITLMKKVSNKKYDKGKVNDLGVVIPFNASELENMINA